MSQLLGDATHCVQESARWSRGVGEVRAVVQRRTVRRSVGLSIVFRFCCSLGLCRWVGRCVLFGGFDGGWCFPSGFRGGW